MSIEDNRLLEILYAVKLRTKSNRELSYFNRYDIRLLELGPAIAAISKLQENMAAIFCSKEVAIRNRLTGLFPGYRIRFIESYEELEHFPEAIKVIFVDQLPSSDQGKVGDIFVSTQAEPRDERTIHLSDLTPELLKRKVVETISLLDNDDREVLDSLKESVGFEQKYRRITTEIVVNDGPYNRSNIAVVESLRASLHKRVASTNFDANQVIKLVNLIIYIRKQISENLGTHNMMPAMDCYISDVSSNLDFLVNSDLYTEAALRNSGEEDPRSLSEAIRRSNQGGVQYASGDGHYITQLDQESYLLDALVALAASSQVAPAIKVPLSNSRLFSTVSSLAIVDRAGGRKTHVMMRRLKDALASYLDEWFEFFDSSRSAAIKIVSNLPLEWANHQGLPIMVRHEVSRIPVTPGYVATRLLLDQDNIHLTLKDFHEVLFISSFAEDDPIRDHLKNKLHAMQDILDGTDETLEALKAVGLVPKDTTIPKGTIEIDVRIKWIEVATREDLVKAINENPCAVTVFDLHGSHSAQCGGVIKLRDEIVSVFDIHRDICVSPIVILSTCDTSPIDRGHRFTAEAFFLAGAKTVVSSALPIESDLASTFMARLLLRIKSFLPARVRGAGMPIRWSTLISGMTRRAYYHELIRHLQHELNFDAETKRNLLFVIGSILDPLQSDWVEKINEIIASTLGLEADQLKTIVQNKVQFIECLKYLQLGRPELILISEDGKY